MHRTKPKSQQMLAFNHQVVCRNCMRTTGVNYRYRFNSQEREKYQSKPEYELMLLLEKWRAEDERHCEFCGSYNLEVFDIDVDEHLLYDFNRLTANAKVEDYFMVNLGIDKNNNQINLKIGSSPDIRWSFYARAFGEILKVIYNRPDSTFKAHPNGTFYINVIVGPTSDSMNSEFTIQRLSYSGLSKDEILDTVKRYKEQNGIL